MNTIYYILVRFEYNKGEWFVVQGIDDKFAEFSTYEEAVEALEPMMDDRSWDFDTALVLHEPYDGEFKIRWAEVRQAKIEQIFE